MTGDFDEDGLLTAADIGALAAAIIEQSADTGFDVNADGNVDSVDHTHWVKELKNTWFGDANLDGESNSGDLVDVLSAGTYEAEVDAGWASGDFDGSGRFDSGDLVVALADGCYEIGPRPAGVPEPSGATLLLIGLVAFKRRTAQLLNSYP